MSDKVANPYHPDGAKITFYDALNDMRSLDNLDVYVTGSNSRMLSSDILTQFRGRSDEIWVDPLSFAEYYSAVGERKMEIIKDNIDKIMIASNYIFKEKYPDNPLNTFYNYWYFFNEYEEELIDTQNVSLETILYSKYYWFSRLTDRFHEIYGFDAGIDQQQSMIIDEMDQRLDHVDWDFVEILYHGES